MKQIVQSFKTGELSVADVPAPGVRSRGILVRTVVSLVSAGTERMVAEFAEKNLLQKAQARPDLVRQVLDKAKREGVLTTLDSVRNRLDQPMALGYSSAGVILQVGAEAEAFEVGDRVACAGGGYASHAEVAYIPRNLAVHIAENVTFEAAAFGSLGAIAMQGIRQAEVVLGHYVAVIGLGLLGQLTVQILKAAGCRVLGMDINAGRAALARELGADAVASDAEAMLALALRDTSGRGVDAVLITADTRSDEPVVLAGQLARDRAIVVAVGAVGLSIPRKAYYEKELDVRLSRSYGPGRYDAEYEEKGHDYPYGYVRFTQQRNIEAFVQLLAQGKVNVQPLISHRFPIEEAQRAYDVITGKTGEPFLGVLITYPDEPNLSRRTTLDGVVLAQPEQIKPQPLQGNVTVGMLGAGNFANASLLPAIRSVAGVELRGIVSGSGLTARHTAAKFGFKYCASDEMELLNDEGINTIVVATRHNLHARQVAAALQSDKHVFCEKPLCLNKEELDKIIALHAEKSRLSIMVGFNRRFAPFITGLKDMLGHVHEPLLLSLRANAGYIPATHWAQDATQGGGRLMGEACHFIDLMIFLAASTPTRVTTLALPNSGKYNYDNFSVAIEFSNGTVGNLIYAANGDKSFGKEYVEVFGGGLSASLDDYRALRIRHNGKTIERTARLRPDKGHGAEWQAFVSHLTRGERSPILFNEIVMSTRVMLAAQQSLLEHTPVIVGETAT